MDTALCNTELVSVIIPTYNSEMFIKRTVYSVLNQTYKNLEVILIDDCSQDNTRDVIKMISKYDNRIRYFFQEKNQGAAVARNIGIRKARGRYLSFLDSDDLWLPEKLYKQVQVLKAGHPFVYCAYDFINENEKLLGGKCRIKSEVTYKDELTKTFISTPTVIYDKEFFGNVQMPLRRTGQDYAFWLLLLSKANAYGIDEALVHIMRREGSLSKNKLQSLIDVYEVQTNFEKIGRLKAGINTFRYFIYALAKRLTRKNNAEEKIK